MESVLPMYNVHPYSSLKILGKKYALYTANYGNSRGTVQWHFELSSA